MHTIKFTFEATPNPATMKFNFNQKIADQPHNFPDIESTELCPLAAKIFGFPWTAAVYLGEDFVSITKQSWVEWDILASPLAGLINEHIESGLPVLVQLDSDQTNDQNDSEIVKQIKKIIKNEIKPVLALDGGDIIFLKYENHILYIRMQGACAGCPSSQATLKEGIEVRIKELIPEVKEVISI